MSKHAKERIRLAEAMGVAPEVPKGFESWQDFVQVMEESELAMGHFQDAMPDPFTDPADDYAVLEWMREHIFFTHGVSMAMRSGLYSYQVGDFARSALAYLEETQ